MLSFVKILACYFVLSLLVYACTFEGRNVFDYVDHIHRFGSLPWSDWMYTMRYSHVTCLYLTDLIYFIELKLFSLDSPMHGIWACFILALNAKLLTIFWQKFIIKSSPTHLYNRYFIHLPAILLIFSPFIGEVIVWGSGIYFAYVSILLLAQLILLEKLIENFRRRIFLWLVAIYILSLFTNEISFIYIPVMYVSYMFLHSFQNIYKSSKLFIMQFWILPLIFISVLSLRLFISGDMIGHYGPDVHLRFDLNEFSTKYIYYFIRFIFQGYAKYFSHSFYACIDKYSILIILTLSGIFISISGFSKNRTKIKPIIFLGIIYTLLLLPVLNLYMAYYSNIDGGRYGYVAYCFFILIISNFFRGLFSNRYILWITAIYIFISLYPLYLGQNAWRLASKKMKQIERFDFGSQNTYFSLNLPVEFQGAFMYKGGYNNVDPLQKRLEIYKKNNQNKFISIYSLNFLGTNGDSTQLIKKSNRDYTLKMINPGGGWFWKGVFGAENYNSNFYQVKLDSWKTYYTLRFDSIPERSFLLHFLPDTLIKIPLSSFNPSSSNQSN